MMPHIVNKADFLAVHNYYGVYQENSTVAAILNSVSETKTIMTYLMNSLKTYASHDSLPVALTEWNINATGSGQGVSFINGMHAALQLGESMQDKYGESSRWDFLLMVKPILRSILHGHPSFICITFKNILGIRWLLQA